MGGTWSGSDGNMKVIPIKLIPFEVFNIILFYLYTLKLQDDLDFDLLRDMDGRAVLQNGTEVFEVITAVGLQNILTIVTELYSAAQTSCLLNDYEYRQHDKLDWSTNGNPYVTKMVENKR